MATGFQKAEQAELLSEVRRRSVVEKVEQDPQRRPSMSIKASVAFSNVGPAEEKTTATDGMFRRTLKEESVSDILQQVCVLFSPSRSYIMVLHSGGAEISCNIGCKHSKRAFMQNQKKKRVYFFSIIIFFLLIVQYKRTKEQKSINLLTFDSNPRCNLSHASYKIPKYPVEKPEQQ